MSEPAINWINMMGRGSNLQRVINAWPKLVDTDALRDTPAPRLLPLSPVMQAQAETGDDVMRVGIIDHAQGMGGALLEHLDREIQTQLGMSDADVIFLTGFFLEPAGGGTTTS